MLVTCTYFCLFVVPLGLPPLVLLLDGFGDEMVSSCVISMLLAWGALLFADEMSNASFGMDKLSDKPIAPLPDRSESRVPDELLLIMILVIASRGGLTCLIADVV